MAVTLHSNVMIKGHGTNSKLTTFTDLLNDITLLKALAIRDLNKPAGPMACLYPYLVSTLLDFM